MNSHPPSRRPSLAPSASLRSFNRRVSALSLSAAEQGDTTRLNPEDQVVADEIDEIKRYEDFTTIDWVRDAAREQQRRKAKRQERAGFQQREGRLGWRRRLWDAYDAGQAWLVVTLIGTAIGLNAAFLNIITEWLSDIKLGHCTTAFYLNESFCCWGAEEGWYTSIPSTYPVLTPRRLCRMAALELSCHFPLYNIHSLLRKLCSSLNLLAMF
jgi:chloride channel 3/4/5